MIARVSVVDVDMPFASMVGFMVKWAIAAIPAFVILVAIGFAIGAGPRRTQPLGPLVGLHRSYGLESGSEKGIVIALDEAAVNWFPCCVNGMLSYFPVKK